jgi:hypothetical protein
MKKLRPSRYSRHCFPAAVVSHTIWLYFRFPLSLPMVEEMLAARSIEVNRETVRQWALKRGGSVCLNSIRLIASSWACRASGKSWERSLIALRSATVRPFRARPPKNPSPASVLQSVI